MADLSFVPTKDVDLTVGSMPPAPILIRFQGDAGQAVRSTVVGLLGGEQRCTVVDGDRPLPVEAGSVVLTLPSGIVAEKPVLDYLVSQSFASRGAVGVGLVDETGVLAHCGAVRSDELPGRAFGAGCVLDSSPMFVVDRRGAELLAPHAQFVASPGMGLAALLADVVVGEFQGSMVARVTGEASSGERGLIRLAEVFPRAVLVIGSSGSRDGDRLALLSAAESGHVIWSTASADSELQHELSRHGVVIFDPVSHPADGLASGFEVMGVLHLDDTYLADDVKAQQLTRSRSGVGSAVMIGASVDYAHRVSVVIEESAVRSWCAGIRESDPPKGRVRAISPVAVSAGVVSIVIPVFGEWAMTASCLRSIRENSPSNLQIVVVDDASPDDTAMHLEAVDDVLVVTNDENLGFPGAVNRGIEACSGEYVCVLNNDTEVVAGWLEQLLAALNVPGTLMVGPRSNEISGLQRVTDAPPLRDLERAHDWGRTWAEDHVAESWRTNRLVGFCLLARRETLVSHGGLDESFGRGNFEDDELCDRLLDAGGDLRVAEGSVVLHHGSATFSGLDEDFVSTLGIASRQRRTGLRHAGDVVVMILSDGDHPRVVSTAWSALGLTDHIRVVERAGADTLSVELARAAHLGVEVYSADWRSPDGALAALGDLTSERVVMVMAGETLEVTDWGAARTEIASTGPGPLGISVDGRAEVRVNALGEALSEAMGRPCGDTLTQLRIRTFTSGSSTVPEQLDPGESATEDTCEPEPEVVTNDVARTFLTAVILCDDGGDDYLATADSALAVADVVVVLDRSGSLSSAYAAIDVIHVDWTDQEELTEALAGLDSTWMLVLEVGERLVVDPDAWQIELGNLSDQPIGLNVGDDVEVRLALCRPDALGQIGAAASTASGGLRLVPASMDHREIIAVRYPELAAPSSLRAALAGKPDWAERVVETMALEEEQRLLEQIRVERPIDWDAEPASIEIGVVLAFDSDGGGDISIDHDESLVETVRSIVGQSWPPAEIVVVVPPGAVLPAAVDGLVRRIDHHGLGPSAGAVERLAKLADLGTRLVQGEWICLVDVGDRLCRDHLEHQVTVAYGDRSETVHGLVVTIEDGDRGQPESAYERQHRDGGLGPIFFFGELRALGMRPLSVLHGEQPSANRSDRLRTLGVIESVAEHATVERVAL